MIRFFLVVICLTLGLPFHTCVAQEDGFEPGWALCGELGGSIEIHSLSSENPFLEGALVGRVLVLRETRDGQHWGGGLGFSLADRLSMSSGGSAQSRWWLLLQHRREITTRPFRSWGMTLGVQVSEDFNGPEGFKTNSLPVLVEVDIHLLKVLTLALSTEFFSYNYPPQQVFIGGVSSMGPETVEESVHRVLLAFRLTFGR